MLKSYEAIYENGHVTWLKEKPSVSSSRIIVTFLIDDSVPEIAPIKRRIPPDSLAGKVKIIGNIVGPMLAEEDWQCLQ